MAFRVECPKCKHRYLAPERLTGKPVGCRKCQHLFRAWPPGMNPNKRSAAATPPPPRVLPIAADAAAHTPTTSNQRPPLDNSTNDVPNTPVDSSSSPSKALPRGSTGALEPIVIEVKPAEVEPVSPRETQHTDEPILRERRKLPARHSERNRPLSWHEIEERKRRKTQADADAASEGGRHRQRSRVQFPSEDDPSYLLNTVLAIILCIAAGIALYLIVWY